jgi:hypothetical protein
MKKAGFDIVEGDLRLLYVYDAKPQTMADELLKKGVYVGSFS